MARGEGKRGLGVRESPGAARVCRKKTGGRKDNNNKKLL